jgi:putative endonuclease
MIQKYFVYIITNKHNRVLYTGVTDNLPRRIMEHKLKAYDGFTNLYNADKLVYYEILNDVLAASSREKQIKGWLRKKKIDLINSKNPEWCDLFSEVSGKFENNG